MYLRKPWYYMGNAGRMPPGDNAQWLSICCKVGRWAGSPSSSQGKVIEWHRCGRGCHCMRVTMYDMLCVPRVYTALCGEAPLRHQRMRFFKASAAAAVAPIQP